MTSRVLEAEVATSLVGELPPSGDPDPERRPERQRVVFGMESANGDRSSDSAILAGIALAALTGLETPEAGGLPNGERYVVVLEHCPACRRIVSPDAEVSDAVASEAFCDAKVVEMRPGPDQGHLTRSVPETTRRCIHEGTLGVELGLPGDLHPLRRAPAREYGGASLWRCPVHALTRLPATSLLALLAGCRSPGPAVPDTGSETDADTDTDADADTDTDVDTDTADSADTAVPNDGCRALPELADTAGGGGRIVLTLATSNGVTGATLADVPLSDFVVDDATHVSGVPGAHVAGVVDIGVLGGDGADTVCAAGFEYWTPAQIVGVDVYLDAGKGVTIDGAGVTGWVDQGLNARQFTQDVEERRPAVVPASFGSLDGIHFDGQQFVRLAALVDLSAAGSSIFAVARWVSGDQTLEGNAGNVPLTLVGDGVSAYGSFGASGGFIQSNHYTGSANLVDGGVLRNDGVARLIGATVDTATEVKLYEGNTQEGLDAYTYPLIGLNSYDTIGAGYAGLDGWDGDVGAVVVVSGVISVDDRTKLDAWAQQRWGTPVSAPLDSWTRNRLTTLPDDWFNRDGAQMVQLASGRILMIGGWSPYDPFVGDGGGAGDRVTNEVWASDDEGVTWGLLLAHDGDAPKEGVGARFPPGHTVGVTTWQGHAVVMGTDCLRPPLEGEVWQESDNGATWTRVAIDAPTSGRCLFMVGSLGDDLYMMGGQVNLYDESTAIADVWRSADGGVSWTQLSDPPWSGRGMVYRPVELDGKLVIVGGGRYDETTCPAYNGVFAFDGTDWTTVLPDGHTQWEASYYNATAALGGRIWLFDGYTSTEELQRAVFSDDGGATWTEFPGGSGGVASHADAVVSVGDRILRVSGALGERSVWEFVPGR